MKPNQLLEVLLLERGRPAAKENTADQLWASAVRLGVGSTARLLEVEELRLPDAQGGQLIHLGSQLRGGSLRSPSRASASEVK